MPRIVLHKFEMNTIVRNGLGCYIADVYYSATSKTWVLDDLRGKLLYYSGRGSAENKALALLSA